MIVKLAEFISKCPALNGERVCVNYLNGDLGSVALVYGDETDEKPYADGGRLSTLNFALAARGEYTKAQGVMKRAASRLSEIENWINTQDKLGNYPDFGDRVTVVSMNTSGFLPKLTGSIDAGYEAEIKLELYRE